LKLHYLVGTEKPFVARLVKSPAVFAVVNLRQPAPDLFGVQEIQEYLGIKIVFFPPDRVQVYDVFEQPVLGLGGDYLTQPAIGAVDEDAPEPSDLRGYRYGGFDFMRVILLQNGR
jgi:hypothetical protein